MLAIDKPIKTSEFSIASSRELIFLFVIKSFFSSERPDLDWFITPLLSVITIFSSLAPKDMYNLVQAIAAAPAPDTTIFTSSIFLLTNSSAFNKAAADIIAVPCWSSCITGISRSLISSLSILKASGALISSRLIPPKVVEIDLTTLINLSGSFSSISISKTSISAKILNRSAFPSITGFDASGPISPRPSTAVPFEITATKFDLLVYLYTFEGSCSISWHGIATPGEYAIAKSLCELYFFVGTTSIFPGFGFAW